MKKLYRAALLFSVSMALASRTQNLPAETAPKPQTTIRIEGAVEKPQTWTLEGLNRDFAKEITTVSYTLKGNKGEARSLPLLALIQAAKPRINAKIKNHPLAFVIFAYGADGYTAAFGLGELLPQYGKRNVWLALDRDGSALPAKESPAELISPDDEKPSRWVHGLIRLRLVDGTKAPR